MKDRGEGGGRFRLAWKPLALASVAALALGAAACGGGSSEEFPAEQIELIVPWEAGGGTDQTARQLASAAEQTCGTDVIVSNQTGSTGAVGFQAAADAEPDGYTVGLVTVEVSMINHLGVATVTPEDVRGVMQYNYDPAAISVAANSEYESVDDLAAAVESGEQLQVATSGTGSIWHVAAAGMAEEMGGSITNVPFDGAAPAITALLGGQVDATSASGAEVAPQVESGKLRPLAVMGDEGISVLPDTPTLKQQGVDWSIGAWRGLAVPNDTPDGRVNKLNNCFEQAYQSEDFQQFMKKQGFGLVYKDAAGFEKYMDEEFRRFGGLIDSLELAQ